MGVEEIIGVEKPEVSHLQIYERLVKVEEKVDSLDKKTSQVVAAFDAASSAFIVLEWIGKVAKPILWLTGLGTVITAIYDRWTK